MPAAEVQELIVTVTVYVPVAVVATFVIEGFCRVLLKPAGPLQFQLAVPAVDVVAERFSVLPLQTGPLLTATGVAGGLGSDNVNGPTTFEGQLFSDTEMLL